MPRALGIITASGGAGQYALVRGLKTLVGNASTNALPNRLFSAEALTQLVAFNAQWIRQDLC
jgi:hypothetical protein